MTYIFLFLISIFFALDFVGFFFPLPISLPIRLLLLDSGNRINEVFFFLSKLDRTLEVSQLIKYHERKICFRNETNFSNRDHSIPDSNFYCYYKKYIYIQKTYRKLNTLLFSHNHSFFLSRNSETWFILFKIQFRI